jgi:hypothetical protein
MGSICFTNIFNEYLELEKTEELFEWFPPTLGIHGLISGKPYIDLEGVGTLKDLNRPD